MLKQGSKLTRAQGPLAPNLPNGPRVLWSGAQRALKCFEPSTYIYLFGPPDLGLGPNVFKSGGPKFRALLKFMYRTGFSERDAESEPTGLREMLCV